MRGMILVRQVGRNLAFSEAIGGQPVKRAFHPSISRAFAYTDSTNGNSFYSSKTGWFKATAFTSLSFFSPLRLWLIVKGATQILFP